MKKLFSTLIILLSVYAINAQVATIVDYTFNSASALPVSPDAVAANLTSSVTMTEAFATKAGTATTGTPFTVNSTAGNALELTPDINSDYYTLSLGGNGLLNYTAFKMYFQAQRSAAGATTLTVTYSVNGGAYQSFAGNTMTVTTSYTAVTFDLSAITAINNPQSLTFKIAASGATGGNVEIDNLEIQANYTLITPTKFTVTNITPASPQAGICFSALVTAVNASGVNGNVTSNTSFLLTTNNGGGISGTTSGTIASGNSSVTVSGIVLGATGSSTLTATASGLTGTSSAFTVQTASAASMSANPSSPINYGTVLVGNSAVQSFQVNTTNLVGNVTVQTPGAPFLVSTSASGPFSNSVALTPSCGSLSQNVYVQYLPTGTGAASGSVTLSATGVSNVVISLSGTGQTPATSFSTGNLVVLSVGNGSTAIANTATPISLVELTTSGFETGDSVSIPSTGATVLTQNGTTGPEGELSLSPDGLYLTYGGYDVTFGTTGNVTSGTGQRAVGFTTNNNTTSIIPGPAGFLSAQNCRGAVTDGCGNFWASSAGSGNGVVYFGSNHANGSVAASPITTARAIGLFNNQLYFSTQSGTYGIYTVDSSTSGTPTTPGAVQTSLIASPSGAALNSTALPFGFFFNPAGTICYIADNRATADSTTGLQVQSGGIERFNLVSGTWTYQYTLPVSANAGVGAAWLTVDFSGTNPIIYATTTEASSNRIIKITDAGATSTYATIATSAFNNVFRGVAFSPSAIATPTQASSLNFTNVLTNSMTANWANNGGTGNLVYINTTNSFTAPSGTAATSGNPAYSGSGQQLVYSGAGNTVNITGLNPTTTYYFEVYAYNQVNCSYQYNTTTATNNPNSQITATPVVPLISVNPSSLSFGNVVVGQTYEQQYTVSASNVSANLTITAPANFGVSLTSGGPYTASLSLSETGGTIAGTIIYVGFTPTSATLYSGSTISNVDAGATTQLVSLTGTGINPAISVSGTVAFGNVNLTNTSLPQSFNVSGTNLISDVTVTAPAGYQVSLSSCTGYASSVSIPVTGTGTAQGGTLTSTPVYVEFTPTSNGSANTNLVVSATQATSQNQAVTGSGVTVTGFGIGNLAVLAIGTGCSPLTSSATAGSLVEFTPAGVQTGYDFAVPSSGGSKLTFSGSASYDGPLGLSTDSLLLVFGGYNASAGTSSVTSGTNPRGVSSLTQNGTYGIVTSSTLFSAGNCRQAASDGCNNYWVTGNASAGGVAYFGNVSPATDVQTTVTNDRGIQLNNGNIYFSTTTTTPGIYSLGAAPVTATAPTLVINTSTGSSGTGSSPAGFVFNKAFTTCYIADDRNTADSTSGLTVESGGIQKWTLVGSTWTYQYTLPVSANGVAGARWLTVDFGGTNPVIYATSAETANNRLVSITDNGSATNGAYNTLSTAGSNYIYRGIAFTPKSVAAPTVQDNSIHFTPITGGSMTVSWTNGNGSGHLVRIDTANLFTHPKFDSTYAGEISTVYTGNGQQAVYSGTGNSVTITGLTAGQTYWIHVYGYNTDNCTVQYDTTTAVDNPVPNINTWTGVTSTSWTIGTNWSTGVAPANSCSSNVFIPAGTPFSPTVSAASSVGDVTLSSGAMLTLTADLTTCGNWIGGTSTNGIVAGTGKLILSNTTGLQTVSGHTQFQKIRLTNSDGAQLQPGATMDVWIEFELETGNFDATNGTLTFKSDQVDSVAIINNFLSGYTGTLSGNIIAERYLLAATTYTQQHEMGSPVNTPTMAQFGSTATNGGYVTPQLDCDEQTLNYTSIYGSVFSTHENAPGAHTCAMAAWYVEPQTDLAANGEGYSVLKAGPATISVTGTANLSNSYTLTGLTNSNWQNTTLQGHNLKSGWHLMGNPYLATLNLTTVNAGFDNQVSVWNANGPFAGTYQSFTVGNNAVIAPFQAFMVHMTAPGSNGSYTINASDRTSAIQTFYNQNDNQLDIIATNLGNGLLDKTTVAFNSQATDNFDPQYDANKTAGSLNRHTLYTTIADGDWMGINVLNSVATTSSVPMGFEPGANGNYSFNFSNINTFDPTTYIYLEDLQQHIMYNVRNGDYFFSADSADNWNRFVLHFTPAAVIAATDADCHRAGAINVTQPGAANWNYTLVNSSNVVIASGVLNQNNPLNFSATVGTYTLTLVDNNNYTVTKQIQVNGAEAITAAFAPSNSTVNTQTLVSFTNTSIDANTFNWSFGDGSNSTLVSPGHTYAAPGTYLVELNAQNISGCNSTTSQTIRVINSATAITPVSENGITMWSNTDRIFIDFSQLDIVDAQIKVYDVLGQQLVNDEFTSSALYQKEIDNTTAACVIVSVKNGGEITTKKLFLINTK